MQVSKNYDQGSVIYDPKHLLMFAAKGKAIYHTRYGVKPAAFIVSMQFRYVMNEISAARLYTIKRRENT